MCLHIYMLVWRGVTMTSSFFVVLFNVGTKQWASNSKEAGLFLVFAPEDLAKVCSDMSLI